MITSGAAPTNKVNNDLKQELDTSLESNAEFEVQHSTDNEALDDIEGTKQNTVDTNVDSLDSLDSLDNVDSLSNRGLEAFIGINSFQPEISSEITSFEDKQRSQNLDVETFQALTAQEAGSGDSLVDTLASKQRLQTLMQEFKSLLERYQQQTLNLAKSFSKIIDTKATDIDLSTIGNVVIQQEDLDGYESGLAQLNHTLSTMESELEAVLRKSEYQELSRQDLEDAHLEMLERLADTSETRCTTAAYEDTQTATKDGATQGKHLDRVGKLCAEIAQTLGCDDAFVSKIASSARLHDIGKLAIPDTILQKPDRLDADEYATMKMHTIHGAKMLENNSSEIIQMAHTIALTHHENWDGTGYPYQLLGEDIALEGRIAAVADVYDALISSRIYKEAWPKEKAIEQIKSRSGTKFDPVIVEAFLKIVL